MKNRAASVHDRLLNIAKQEHGGIRGSNGGYLGLARTRLQVDMGFGDVITGGPVRRPYRTLLDDRSLLDSNAFG